MLFFTLRKALPKPVSALKNSKTLIEILSNLNFSQNHITMSLDVTSLFTNVPTELVLKGIDRRWPLIKKVTYFKFYNKYYKKIVGTPMGSPISPLSQT